MSQIFNYLQELGLTSPATAELFRAGTRDREDLRVWRDSVSKIIFLDEITVDQVDYSLIDFRNRRPNYQRFLDCKRRVQDFKSYYVAKRICDFGCGEGLFLQEVREVSKAVIGIEIQKACKENLEEKSIEVAESFDETDPTIKFDTIFAFHSFEHLGRPHDFLCHAFERLSDDGSLIVEVPHAKDFLLDGLSCDEFIKHTLWSQHLILHTRDSLERCLRAAGFTNILIRGLQRYPLSNHLGWLAGGKPGGHQSMLSIIDSPQLSVTYGDSLARIDRTDTLVAVASK